MKSLILFPPQWIPTNPYFSVPILCGQLERASIAYDCYDLNIEFYNEIFTTKFLRECLEKAQFQRKIINSKKNWNCNISNIENKILLNKRKILNEYIDKKQKHAIQAIQYIEDAKNILRSNEFYNFGSYYKAHRIIEYALELASLPFAPSKIKLTDYNNPLFKANYNEIIYQIDKRDINPFIDFFENRFKDKKIDHELILISITAKSQLVPTFTLINILRNKLKYDGHISIGGNLINRVFENFIKHSEVFDSYIDSLLIGDGEENIVKLAHTIEKKESLSNIPNLIYKNKHSICKNDIKPLSNINLIAYPSLKGYDLSKYFSPETIMLIQATKGCYWGQCTFCDLTYGKNFSEKQINKLVDEIQYFYEKYNINKFWFIDESISAKYYLDFANEILNRNLKINYYGLARLEKNFTKETCSILYKSGLRNLMWGYECASERVFKLMNKGVNPNTRLQILKNAHESLIWNHIFLIFGFPSESKKEAEETISTIIRNKKIIDSYHAHLFSLQKHSLIIKKHNLYNIKEFVENEEFEECYNFIYGKEPFYVSQKVLLEKLYILSKKFWKKNNTNIYKYLLSTDFLLYLSKYGIDWLKVSKYNLLNKRNQG